MKELVIIGAGPAGLAAGIYAARSGMDFAVFERYSPGGQVLNTWEVENYPGFTDPIPGWELMSRMEAQARRLGVDIESHEVSNIVRSDRIFSIIGTDNSLIETKTVIIASGASMKRLGVPGETEFTGRGVSYCATCDGAFFREKKVIVVGGGNTALEEAIFLTRFASSVKIVHRRDEFRADRILQERAANNQNIEYLYSNIVERIEGTDKVNGVILRDKKSQKTSFCESDGVFIFVGSDPNTGFVPAELMNNRGEIKTDKNLETTWQGCFAAGDLREGSKRQILMAASDGATAAMSAYEYILGLT